MKKSAENKRTARDGSDKNIQKSCTARDCCRFWSKNGRTPRDGWIFWKIMNFVSFYEIFQKPIKILKKFRAKNHEILTKY